MLTNDPLWFKDAIIYELHVKSFFDSNDDGYGDFKGLLEKLDYIKDLGVNCLWILPFYPSPLLDDGYDIADYRGINPLYGKSRDVQAFIRKAHDLGIRVITELVVNHTSDQHPWFQAARHAPAGSAKRDFYVWSDTNTKYSKARIIFTDTEESNWTWDPVAKAYYWHRFFSHQPDLNYENPQVRKAILRTMRYWLDMGVDGLRLDAVPYLCEQEGTNCENLPGTHAILKEWRKVVDENYADKIFLAEANQWPADVCEYFGDGDECHMAYHFPVMPRLFMALNQEDRLPVVDILRQTPNIPENCQWAIFLRNHDELTLEMVTDEERDYMFKAYAADARMKLNVGIRRRLAPLINHNRRAMELLNSLLFSLPGSPIIYYGDEIGMGDNVFMGDRDGVRTPMQWSGDRNGGFSKADFARLYSPPIMDPVFGYQAINVEAQLRDSSSLLVWMKRIIGVRKSSRVFGWGSTELLHPQNRKVLAFTRTYKDETVLVVANLSRYCQPVGLDLSRYEGVIPVEMFGQIEFPRIGAELYPLSLGPHSFYWFRFDKEHLPIAAPSGEISQDVHAGSIDHKVLELEKNPSELFDGATLRRLSKDILPPFLQRFAAGEKIKSVSVRDWACLRNNDLMVVALAKFENGQEQLFVLPLCFMPAGAQVNLDHVLARVRSLASGDTLLCDFSQDEKFFHDIVKRVLKGGKVETGRGQIRFVSTGAVALGSGYKNVDVKLMEGEYTNNIFEIGGKFVLKFYRNPKVGLNPDAQIGVFLTVHPYFRYSPKVAGYIEYTTEDGIYTIATLQERIDNQGTCWDYTVDTLRRFYELSQTHMHLMDKLRHGYDPWKLYIDSPPTRDINDLYGIYHTEATLMGKRVAQMHLALGGRNKNPEFAPEPMTKNDVMLLLEQAQGSVDNAKQALAEFVASSVPAGLLPVEDAFSVLMTYGKKIKSMFKAFEKYEPDFDKIRIHGGLNLAKILCSRGDFYIFDFEGLPYIDIKNNEKDCALWDVARMLRSFSYAAFGAFYTFVQNSGRDVDAVLPWAKLWQKWISIAFLQGYIQTAEGALFLPADRDAFFRILDILIIDLACRQIARESKRQPEWLATSLMSTFAYFEQNFA